MMREKDHVLFQMSASRGFHAVMSAQLRVENLEDGAPHEAVPTAVLNDPEVLGAVRQLLGDSARPDGCAHVHVNPSAEPGPWHVDDYCGQPWPAGVQFAILCYFPQDTTPEMGPTAIRVDGREITGAGPAGTCLLMRHTVDHRATANTSGKHRLMVKYLFRDDEPS